jgi:hypothetical protein
VNCKPWQVVILGNQMFSLKDGIVFGKDEIEQIDSSGWDFMLSQGMIPLAMV